jgi:hypothetical protein
LYPVGGITEFPKFFNFLTVASKINSFLKTIIVVRDAESDYNAAKDSITAFLKNNNFAVPSEPCKLVKPKKGEHNIAIGFALFPSFTLSDPGTLEDLCLNTLKDRNSEQLLHVVDRALCDAKIILNIGTFKRYHKNRLHTYLSLTDKFVTKNLGIASEAGAFNFSSKLLQPFKDMMLEIININLNK